MNDGLYRLETVDCEWCHEDISGISTSIIAYPGINNEQRLLRERFCSTDHARAWFQSLASNWWLNPVPEVSGNG